MERARACGMAIDHKKKANVSGPTTSLSHLQRSSFHITKNFYSLLRLLLQDEKINHALVAIRQEMEFQLGGLKVRFTADDSEEDSPRPDFMGIAIENYQHQDVLMA